jgi:TRAP-type uncharacterized transport system substrate-binding protein
MPEFSPSKIAAGTYRLLEKDYGTIGIFNFVIGRDDFPDELVHQSVKAVFQNQPRLLKAHSAVREIIPKNVEKDTFLSLHPGGINYYREIRVPIPDALTRMN